MIRFEEDSVVVHVSGIIATSKILFVFPDMTMNGTDVPSLLVVLLETCVILAKSTKDTRLILRWQSDFVIIFVSSY